MNTYIEYVILENVIVNFAILCQISICIKCKLKIKNTIFSILLITIYSTINYYLDLALIESIAIKFLIIIIGIYIAFKPCKFILLLKQLVYYYLISFMFVGIIISITLLFKVSLNNILLKLNIYIISGIISFLFNKFMWKLWKSNIKSETLMYNISIKNIDLNINALVDTGNSVYDYINNLDVIFIDKKYFDIFYKNKLLKDKVNINVNTVSSEENLVGYIVNNVNISNKNSEIFNFKKIIFVFTNKKLNEFEKFSAIIGYNTYIEKLKGVLLC